MPYLGIELHLWWLEWIIRWDCNINNENTSKVRSITLYSKSKVKHMYVYSYLVNTKNIQFLPSISLLKTGKNVYLVTKCKHRCGALYHCDIA